MSNISQLLAAALSVASITDDFRRIVETRVEPVSRGKFCNMCLFLDGLIILFENSVYTQQFRDLMQSMLGHDADVIRDIDLGRRSELLTRSSNCLTCSTFLSYADEYAAAAHDEHATDFATDYVFSAHLMDDNPVLAIAFGPSSATPVSERRAVLHDIPVLWLFSMNEKLPTSPGGWPAGTPRLFDPEQVDPAQIRGWLDCCQNSHGQKCRPGGSAYSIQAKVLPRFIDVERQCIVQPDHKVSYVALSYVWGPVETLQATKATIDSLSRPGSLSTWSTHAVPATIRDAMKLCTLVGQRYLWVDRVCIIQDDTENKWQHLEAMADTYAKAEFTIVAADGSHADHGLSGLGRRTAERRKYGVSFPSRLMMRGTMKAIGKNRLAGTTWSTRAWTFQEHVFSGRLLYMDTITSWFCYSATWHELWSLPSATAGDAAEGLDLHGKGEKLFAVDWPSLHEYANMVEQYNLRQLTYDSDILNAFLGIMTQMCSGFPAGFHGGLPEFYFTIGLLWQPGEGLRPRFPEAAQAPSWSWLGWSGKLDLTLWRYNTDAQLPRTEIETIITPMVKFFKKQDRANEVSSRIDDTFHVVRTHFTVKAGSSPDSWQKHDGDKDSGSEPFYTYLGYSGPSHIDTNRKFRYPIPPFQRPRDINPIDVEDQKLYFSTQRAFFTIGKPENGSPWRVGDQKDGKYYAVDVPIFTATGMWAGSIRVNARDNENIPTGDKAEVICIAKGSVPTTQDSAGRTAQSQQESCHPFGDCIQREELETETSYEFYFVLWIDRDNVQVRRKALGTVWERVWSHAEPEEVDIVFA